MDDRELEAYESGVVPIYEIPISDAQLRELTVTEALDKIDDAFTALLEGLEDKTRHIVFTNYPVMIPAGCRDLLIEDFRRVALQVNDSGSGWGTAVYRPAMDYQHPPCGPWNFPTGAEAKKVLSSLRDELEQAAFQTDSSGSKRSIDAISYRANVVAAYPSSCLMIRSSSNSMYESGKHFSVMDIRVCHIASKIGVQRFVLQSRLIPDFLTEDQQQVLDIFYSMLEKDYLVMIDGDDELDFDVGDRISDPESQSMLYGLSSIAQYSAEQQLPTEAAVELLDQILQADQVRAEIMPEDRRKLEDPNGGVWELWEVVKRGGRTIQLPSLVYARDPRLDVLEGGVVGIDFGTRSTVVSCMSGEGGEDLIRPMRIGTGHYEQEVAASDYENPTVMEFRNLRKFLSEYNAGGGRPDTHWVDMTVSHTAQEKHAALNEQDSARYSAAYFSNLKLWASGAWKQVRIRDIVSTQEGLAGVILPPYLQVQDGDLDPIEYYAYYIGLYINNMRTKRIYLKYLLSFPVTFEKAVREHILSSFRRGILKAMPQSILDDSQLMDRFSVEEGAGEPAAYAVCALQEFGFLPKQGEQVYFGVFDFGGGTTDFDFGLWRQANGGKERRYRYIVHHFYSGGDRYLGGENLLTELAYRVFQDNQVVLRSAQIQFTRPPEGNIFPGYELLIDETQEAQTNTRSLAEALRPLWERKEGETAPVFGEGIVRCNLYRRDGKQLENVELTVNEEALTQRLRMRIELGVDRFFEGLLATLRGPMREEIRGDTNMYNIFLAGNSSKSILVQDVFRSKIEELDKQLKDEAISNGEEPPETFFTLFYPLGTPEAEQQRKDRGLIEYEPTLDYRPTGKTGVSFGLLQCRRGGKIKVVNEVGLGEDPKFRYWVGDDVNGCFHYYLSRDSAYNEWVEFWPAEVSDFEFRYTMSPAASRQDQLPTRETKLRRCEFPRSVENEDWVICLRPVKPEELEYVVAESVEAANSGDYRCDPVRVSLCDG